MRCILCELFFNKAVVVFKNKGRKRGREGRRKEGQGPFAPHHFLIHLQDLELGVFCAPSCKDLCLYTGIPGCDP